MFIDSSLTSRLAPFERSRSDVLRRSIDISPLRGETRIERSRCVLYYHPPNDAEGSIDHLFWRRGLVVSPSAFQEPSDAAFRARRQQSHLRQLDFDGPGFGKEQRSGPADRAQA